MSEETKKVKAQLTVKQVFLLCCITFVASVVINSFSIYCEYQVVSGNGPRGMIGEDMILMFPIFAALILILISFPCLLFLKSKRLCLAILLCSVIYMAGAKTCFIIANRVRTSAFHRLVQRSEPLIIAINNYEAKHGNPPAVLKDLVPEFLDTIPKTGIKAYPEYEYKVGPQAQEFAQDRWCLIVNTPRGVLNWDIFIYFPGQNYPDRGYGGVLEKIGNWAYVHE